MVPQEEGKLAPPQAQRSALPKAVKRPIKSRQAIQSRAGGTLSFSLLLGGPNGDHRFDPSRKTAICLHGLDQSSEYWSRDVFGVARGKEVLQRTKAMRPAWVPQPTKESERKRAVLVKELAKHMNVILLDQRGFGESSCPSTPDAGATLADLCADVEDVLKHFGIKKAAIVGHSMGAMVTLQHAVNNKESIDRLCTIGGSPLIGQAAQKMWLSQAKTATGWTANIIEHAIVPYKIDPEVLRDLGCPTLLINAEDDRVTPKTGSQMLKAYMPCASLEIPLWGGHDLLISNDQALERLVRFMMAEDYMLFANDVIFALRLQSIWNLASDEALTAYYRIGRKLAEVEASERRARRSHAWVAMVEESERDFLASAYRRKDFMTEMQKQKEEVGKAHDKRLEMLRQEGAIMSVVIEEVMEILREYDLSESVPSDSMDAYMEGDLTPKALILKIMGVLVHSMTEPAQAIVEEGGTWWKDTGKQSSGYVEGKYTVDAMGRRRGRSGKHNCAWFRWDKYCCPTALAASSGEANTLAPAVGGEDPALFACWWCGGHAGDHELLAEGQNAETPGSTGPGRGPAAPRPTTAPATKAMAEVKGEDAAVPTAGDDATAEEEKVDWQDKQDEAGDVQEDEAANTKEKVEEGDPENAEDDVTWVRLETAEYHQLLAEAGLRRRVTRFQGAKFNRIDLSQVVQDRSSQRATTSDAQVPKWLMPGHSAPPLLRSPLHYAQQMKSVEIAG
mmetsp:Transcript_33358/g.76111  ORF Transcript_33358/g.76111 Transcript_33358/m.76111 type:complete len:732 (-) Transcript_33358:25-2220(-)